MENEPVSTTLTSDLGSATAKSFGIAFDLSDELRPIYAQFGHALPDMNGDDSWVLPLPATYVIDTDGTIVLAFLDVDYRNRLEPGEILAALQALEREHQVLKARSVETAQHHVHGLKSGLCSGQQKTERQYDDCLP
jgi:hypothetical protein